MSRTCLDTVKACWPQPLPPSIEGWIEIRCVAGVPPWVIFFVLVDMLRRPDKSASEHDRKIFKRIIFTLEKHPREAEELLKADGKSLDLDQWQQLLEAVRKLWPHFDDAFVFVLFDAFESGFLKSENLKAWLDAYLSASAPSSSEPQ